MFITKYAQSTVEVLENGKKLLIDPGKYNYDPGRVTRDYFKDVSVLLITHKHADHYDLEAIRQIYNQCKPFIYTVKEIYEWLTTEGITAAVLQENEQISHKPFNITAIPTNHLYEGEKVDCFGVLIEVQNKKIYHASDTLYLKAKPMADVLFVPINNRGVSMNQDEAVQFSKEVNPQIAIPVHYDSPKDKHINPKDFVDKMQGSGIEVKVLSFGERFEL